MLFNIIMAVFIYPCILLVAFFAYKLSRFEKGLYFGASMKKEWYENPENNKELLEIKSVYVKEFRTIMIISFMLSAIIFFIPYISLQITAWLVWIFAMLVVCVIPQGRAFKKICAWKKEKGLYEEEEEVGQICAELSTETRGAKLQIKDFLIPIAITCLTVLSPIISNLKNRIVDPVLMPLYICMLISGLIVILTMFFVTKYINNRMPRIISKDSNVNRNYKRAGDMIWSSVFKQISWATVIYVLMFALAFWKEDLYFTITIFGSILYAIVIIVICVIGVNTQSKVDKAYADKFEFKVDLDNDKCWIWGILYYNPKDRRNFVNTRMGMGLESNMAKPLGKMLTGVGIVAILGCLIMCLWIVAMEFSPMELHINNNRLQAYHLGVKYDIDTKQIEDISLLTELPSMSKSSGNAMDEQLEGDFYIRTEQRKCKVMLNPKNQHFLRIEANGQLYYLGDKDDTVTIEIYDSLTQG